MVDAVNWGRFDYLTLDQEAAMEALLESHADELEAIRYSVESPEECALRFLRARKFDTEKTHEIIAEALQKFKEVGDSPRSIPDQPTFRIATHADLSFLSFFSCYRAEPLSMRI